MKVDKDNPLHWLQLILSGIMILSSLPFRVFRNKNKKSIVFFYQMHGNSKAFAEYLQARDKSIEIYFLAFPKYLEIYRDNHKYTELNMLKLTDMIKVAQCDAIITNYQPLTLIYYAKLSNIKFIDVGHGLPLLKKFTPKKLKYLNAYTETWVASPTMKKEFRNLYRIKTPIVPTGYARVDRLVNDSYKNIRQKYGLPNKKIVLIAPTWQQNNPGRNILPFSASENDFFKQVDKIGRQINCLIIVRLHMLSEIKVDIDKFKNVKLMSVQNYPDTEELLSITDILVTDWSSIAYDWLPLHKPTLFLDVKTPFVGQEDAQRTNTEFRFGEIVGNFSALKQSIEHYLKSPDAFKKSLSKQIKKAEEFAYGETLDGKATERYYKRLIKIIGT